MGGAAPGMQSTVVTQLITAKLLQVSAQIALASGAWIACHRSPPPQHHRQLQHHQTAQVVHWMHALTNVPWTCLPNVSLLARGGAQVILWCRHHKVEMFVGLFHF